MGKTTAAAATAIQLSRTGGFKKVLVVSTDPAHSLGDSLACPVGTRTQPMPVPEIRNLWALEMGAPASLESFKEKYQAVITEILERGTYLEREDIASFFGLSLPGLDEAMAILDIADLTREGEYDLVICDTAPTGHTLRLLSMPEQMLKWIQILDLMQEKQRYLVRCFARRYRANNADVFLKKMVADLKRVRGLLKFATTQFVPVVVPEPMATRETERLLTALHGLGIPVKSIVVNRVEDGQDQCSFCRSRRADQRETLSQMRKQFCAYDLVTIPAFPDEVRGLRALTLFAGLLFGETQSVDRRSPPLHIPERRISEASVLSELLEEQKKLLFFVGKGGVGKTTLAAATALRLARSQSTKKILIYSMDPAHSLSDSFQCSLGPQATQIPGLANLDGVEIDASEAFRVYRETYRTGVRRALEQTETMGAQVRFDLDLIQALFDLSPPGLDEMMALERLADLVDMGTYDVFVLDAAATGHLIRFLELPGVMREWLQILFKVLLKYKMLFCRAGMSDLIERLLESSRRVRRIQGLLTHPRETEFVVVTIPEAMSVLEAKRLLSTLRLLHVPSSHLVINKMIPPTDCEFCSRKSAQEQTYLEEFRTLETRITLIPLLPHEISGLETLDQLCGIAFDRAVPCV